MRKFSLKTAAAGAALSALAAPTFGQQISPAAPIVTNANSGNDAEYVGSGEGQSTSFVVVNIDAQNTNDQAGNNTTVLVRFWDAAGGQLLGGTGVAVQDEDGNQATGLFQQVPGQGNDDNNIETGEVWGFNVEDAIAGVAANAAFLTIELIEDADDDGVLDGGGTTAAFATGFDGADFDGSNANNEAYQIIRESTTISQGLFEVMDPTNTSEFNMFFNFPVVGIATNEQVPVTLFDANANNINATQTGGGAATDFNFVDSGGTPTEQFNSGTAPAGTADINAASFANPASEVVLRWTFDSANSMIDSTSVTFAVDQATGTVRDSAGNLVQGSVTPAQRQDLAIDSVNFIDSTTAEITFNLAIDDSASGNGGGLGAIPNDVFNLLIGEDEVTSGGGNSAITGVTTGDAADDNVLNVNIAGAFDDVTLSIADSGQAVDTDDGDANSIDGANGSMFTLEINEADDAQDNDLIDLLGGSFGGADDDDAQAVTVGDMIPLAFRAASFHDLNGDGNLDAVAFIANEPIDASTIGAAGFTLFLRDGAMVTVIPSESTTGELPDPVELELADDEDQEITGATASAGSLDPDPNNANFPDFLESDNAVVFDLSTSTNLETLLDGDTPSSGDANVFRVAYDPDDGNLADAAGNAIPGDDDDTTDDIDQNTATDLAPAVLFFAGVTDGENVAGGQIPFETPTNNPTVANIGDDNPDNLELCFSEDVMGGAFTQTSSVVVDGQQYPNNAVVANVDNCVTLGDPSVTPAEGDTVTINANNNLSDGTNPAAASGTQTALSRQAAYVSLVEDVNGTAVHNAFLVPDEDGENATDIRLIFNQPIDGDTVSADDFSVSVGEITGVSVSGATVDLAVDGVLIGSTVTVTYNGTSADPLIASDADTGGSGVAVDAVDASIDIQQLADAFVDSQFAATMDVQGGVSGDFDDDGETENAPIGTKVYAFNAVPVVRQITANHNNIAFIETLGIDISSEGNTTSLNAFTNWLHGIASKVFLIRGDNNNQFYANEKDVPGADGDEFTIADVIGLNINANNLQNISFSGNGETNQDKVNQGQVQLCWDVLRSNAGTIQDYILNGFALNGKPIISSTVIDDDSGEYVLHVSGPTSAFSGNSKFNSTNWPIILVVELPDGRRFAASGLYNSVNGGPLLFQPTQTDQENDGSANDAATFDINLQNVGNEKIEQGWNTVPFGRVGGAASASNQLPMLPSGVTQDDVQIGTNLSFVDPVDQFVYFLDTNGDGDWTSADDGVGDRFDGIIVDADCTPHYAFTMTSNGIQAGNAINNLVGGYALGFFWANNAGASNALGCFQFGAPLSESSIFGGNFNNTNSNQGWFLGTRTTADTADNVASADDLDYLIFFENLGWDNNNNQLIQVRSNSFGNDGPADLEEITADEVPAAIFGHVAGN